MLTDQIPRSLQGTFGCAAGHLRVMKTAHDKSRAPFALVFEDDIHPHEVTRDGSIWVVAARHPSDAIVACLMPIPGMLLRLLIMVKTC